MYFLADHISPRLEFISRLIMEELLGIPLTLVTNPSDIPQNVPVINYRQEELPGTFYLPPVNLLFEEGIREQDIWVADWKGYPVFFLCPERADFRFDLFAASFYLVSSYEEYFVQSLDEHGRYSAENSLPYLNRFHERPVVNQWALKFLEVLREQFPGLQASPREYTFRSTIDVDQPFAFIGKGALRNLGGLLQDLRKGKRVAVKRRIRVLLNRQKDPYDTFNYLIGLHERYSTKPMFFVSVGKRSFYDKNISPFFPRYRKLIQKLVKDFDVGLHPSYRSVEHTEQLTLERRKLERVCRGKITRSRQHYLRLRFPKTYRRLIEEGLGEDYTMGFAREPGFRSGIAAPYNFYDLFAEKCTSLRIHPFALMDGTLKDYKRLTAGDAAELSKRIISEVKSVGGMLITVWHNSSLAESGGWAGWENVLETILHEASDKTRQT